ncbi:MAG TPA: cation:proton antiporter [Solirubrobacteraceae bacterium]|nr:cation:proton antiporter [Solirubrobacteraceae bacterium]
MSAGADLPRHVPRRRLIGYYAILAAVTAIVVPIEVLAGSDKHAEPAIAGNYMISAGTACLGPTAEVMQSGRFVTISNTQGTLSGNLTLKHKHLTGTVTCVTGAKAAIAARGGTFLLTGAIGGQPLRAQLVAQPPSPGSPTPLVPGSVSGVYSIAPASVCLGTTMTLGGPSSRVTLTTSKPRGVLSFHKGMLAGTVHCNFGGTRTLTAAAAGRALTITLTPPPEAGVGPERLSATLSRTPDQTVLAFFIAALIVVLFCRLVGSLMPRLGQPRVMGEVLGGIMLGPTVFGAIDPGLQAKVFASDITPYIGVTANLGLIFYMFLIGLEVDFSQIKGRVGTTLAVSNTGLAVPMMLGLASAIPLYEILGPNKRYLAFALFMGVSMSVTAFPVLARVISERRMLRRPLGVLALSAAAIDDVSAWFLIALATAVAGAGDALGVLRTVAEVGVFCVVMGFAVRPLLARAAVAYDEAGRVPGTWITIIFAGVLLSSIATDKIGVAVIFGAFVMGLSMPRHAGLSHEVTKRVEDFVLTLLLPLYFAYTGLRTNVGLLGRPELILITVALITIAIAGKFGGTMIAARTMKLPWRESAALSTLMNTRGLTELIVLNLALDLGVITAALFAALVVMAIVTTLMTGPLMRLIDPKGTFGSPPEDELAAASRLVVEATPEPTRSILVAPQTDTALESLLAIAAPLAAWEPPRELILARLVPPPRGSTVRGGLQTEALLVNTASDQVQRARLELLDFGVASRAVALASAHPGRDLVRLSTSEEVDLVLLDGRRSILGDGLPRDDVGTVLEKSPCDVALLVARDGVVVAPGPDAIVMVPFGGAEHDWAALELGAWLCAATGATLELLGPPGVSDDGKDAGHMLANAALLVQQFAGVSARPVVAEPGREGLIAAAGRAGLLVVGLSERWRKEGLGETRQAIAKSAPAPILFVRRGERPGALAPATDVTTFGWSSAGMGVPRAFSRSFSRAFAVPPGLGPLAPRAPGSDAE